MAGPLFADHPFPFNIANQRIEDEIVFIFPIFCLVDAAESGDRDSASSAKFTQDGAFSFCGMACRPVVEEIEQEVSSLVIDPRFNPKRALTDSREHLGEIDLGGDPFCQAEPDQARGSENYGIVLTVVQFSQSRIDVAAQLADLQVRSLIKQLSASPQTACADLRALW